MTVNYRNFKVTPSTAVRMHSEISHEPRRQWNYLVRVGENEYIPSISRSDLHWAVKHAYFSHTPIAAATLNWKRHLYSLWKRVGENNNERQTKRYIKNFQAWRNLALPCYDLLGPKCSWPCCYCSCSWF